MFPIQLWPHYLMFNVVLPAFKSLPSGTAVGEIVDSETLVHMVDMIALLVGMVVMGVLFTWNLSQTNYRWQSIYQLLLDSRKKEEEKRLRIMQFLLDSLMTNEVSTEKKVLIEAIINELTDERSNENENE